jgi:hypothetical protein
MRFILIFSIVSVVHLSCETEEHIFDGYRAYKHLLDQCELGQEILVLWVTWLQKVYS